MRSGKELSPTRAHDRRLQNWGMSWKRSLRQIQSGSPRFAKVTSISLSEVEGDTGFLEMLSRSSERGQKSGALDSQEIPGKSCSSVITPRAIALRCALLVSARDSRFSRGGPTISRRCLGVDLDWQPQGFRPSISELNLRASVS